ncbi:MAG: hypothetical protein P8189_11505, partial [Anaerolineae bacterium]
MNESSGMFLDPERPLSTCAATSCEGCSLRSQVHCHFQARDLGRFLLAVMPPFLVGGIAIVRVGWPWLIPWVLSFLGYFGLVEIRVMCSHCPH